MILFWSCAAAHTGRMPGVTMTRSRPYSLRRTSISWGEQTTPSRPAALASPASRSTCALTSEAMPTSSRSAPLRLVRTVTPSRMGLGPLPASAAALAASAALAIISRPPEVWMVIIWTPCLRAERTAPATVLGMSWSLRSRKMSLRRALSLRKRAGPSAVKSSRPTLKVRASLSRLTSAMPSSLVWTSRAMMMRSAFVAVMGGASFLSLGCLERADNLTDGGDLVVQAPALDPGHDPDGGVGVDEAGRPDLDRGRAGDQELESVGPGHDPAHADDRDLETRGDLVDHAQSDRLDGRPAQPSVDVAELGPA